MVYTLVFYTGERPWSAARRLSEIVKVSEAGKMYFNDYRMNMVEICSDSNYNFNEKDVHDMFYLIRAIYNQSVHEDGVLESFGKVKRDIVKLVEEVTDIKWMNKEDLDKEETVDMCEAERAWEASKIQQGITQGIKDANRATYQTMLQNGLSIEQIAKYCSVSVESIQELIK